MIDNQIHRPGNANFKFFIEAPEGNAKDVHWFQTLQIPVEAGGVGAKRTRLYCETQSNRTGLLSCPSIDISPCVVACRLQVRHPLCEADIFLDEHQELDRGAG